MDKLPIGSGCEVFTIRALEKCVVDMDRSVSEYLMLFMFQPQKFRCGVMYIDGQDYGNYSLTVDMPADLERTKSILTHLNFTNDFKGIKLKHILKVINEKPDLPAIKYEPSGDVKLPYGKVIPFTAFKADMNERINLSFQKGIDE
jgi:spore coat polysaccharide biosynthesis protein SpsF (cytidylyltransferase family)